MEIRISVVWNLEQIFVDSKASIFLINGYIMDIQNDTRKAKVKRVYLLLLSSPIVSRAFLSFSSLKAMKNKKKERWNIGGNKQNCNFNAINAKIMLEIRARRYGRYIIRNYNMYCAKTWKSWTEEYGYSKERYDNANYTTKIKRDL